MRCDYIYRRYITSILTLGFVLEALTPNKISTVSYRKAIKDLSISNFIATAPVLYKVYESILNEEITTPRIGYWIYVIANEIINNEFIKTNTCLGYSILTIPIIYAAKNYDNISSPDELARKATDLIFSATPNENAETFYKALQVLSKSYMNRYVGSIPDISLGVTNNCSLLDVFVESSFWDLIAYEVTHQYEITLKTYRYMNEMFKEGQPNILECISKTQYYLLSEYLDSEVVKSLGVGRALFIKSYQKIINLLSKYKETQYKLSELLDTYLRSNNINLGTIADILALATSFTLLEHSKPLNIE